MTYSQTKGNTMKNFLKLFLFVVFMILTFPFGPVIYIAYKFWKK